MVNINNISSNVLEDLVFSKDELEELKRARRVLSMSQNAVYKIMIYRENAGLNCTCKQEFCCRILLIIGI